MQKYLVTKVNIMPILLCCVLNHSTLVEEVILVMVKKTMDLHVLLNLGSTTIKATNFDLLMFKGGVRHICLNNQLHKLILNPYACYYFFV